MQEALNQAMIEEAYDNVTTNKLEILDYLSYSTYQVNLFGIFGKVIFVQSL
jgi:hypothetical protein